MRKVSAIHKNKICAVLLVAILIICCIPLPAFASETTLTTTVPAQVSVKLEVEGNGKVEVNGKSYTESTTIEVNRHTKTEFYIIPNSDYELTAVLYNGEDVFSELSGNTFALQEVIGDSVLRIIFTPKSNSPQTGDSDFRLWAYTAWIEIFMIVMSFVIKKEKAK